MKEGIENMNDMYCNDCFNFESSYERPINYSPSMHYDPMCLNANRSSSSSYSSSFVNDRVDSFFNPAEGFAKGNMQADTYKPYKLTNPSLPQVYTERQRMLLEVQKYGFAMWDLNLYLNTHPTDRNTMRLFEQYRNSYKKAKRDYESRYGALCFEDTKTDSGYWEWNRSPWPWEGE